MCRVAPEQAPIGSPWWWQVRTYGWIPPLPQQPVNEFQLCGKGVSQTSVLPRSLVLSVSISHPWDWRQGHPTRDEGEYTSPLQQPGPARQEGYSLFGDLGGIPRASFGIRMTACVFSADRAS